MTTISDVMAAAQTAIELGDYAAAVDVLVSNRMKPDDDLLHRASKAMTQHYADGFVYQMNWYGNRIRIHSFPAASDKGAALIAFWDEHFPD